jgi:outer membrane protein OmpA-like peptidoglycan-associated protein
VKGKTMYKRIVTIIASVITIMFLTGCLISTDTIRYWNGADQGMIYQTGPCIEIMEEVIPDAQVITIKEIVMFEWDSNIISTKGEKLLDKVAEVMKENPDLNLVLTGYASVEGNTDYNQDLSQRRVDAVHVTLMQKGVKGNRMTTSANGETGFFGDLLDLNRRVMVLSVD